MMHTYAFGDIHGCLSKLQKLVRLCQADAGRRPTKLVFLGDYTDRGPNSRGVIEYLIALQRAQPKDVICLMGNHEDMLLAAVDDAAWEEQWLHNGGIRTLESYRVASAEDLPKDHVDWIRELPKFHNDGLRFYVHAGIDPARRLDQQDEHDLLWMREPFLSSEKDFGRLIVHGHTPLRGGKPDIRFNRLNIDTGAVYGGPLTAAVFTGRSPAPKRFLSSQSD